MGITIQIHGAIESADVFNDLTEALGIMESHRVAPSGYVTTNPDGKANALAARNLLLQSNREDVGFSVEYEYTPDEGVAALVAFAKKHVVDISFKRKWGMDGSGQVFVVRDGVESIKLPLVNNKIAVTTDLVKKMAARGMSSTDELLDMMDKFEREPNLPRFSVADDVVMELVVPRRGR